MRNTAYKEIADNARSRPGKTLGPPFDSTFIVTEDEDSTTLDHRLSFKVIEASNAARDNSLTSSLDETKSIASCLDKAMERDFVGRVV